MIQPTGCTPIPEDNTYYWSVVYDDSQVSVTKGQAPITYDMTRTANISCQVSCFLLFCYHGYNTTTNSDFCVVKYTLLSLIKLVYFKKLLNKKLFFLETTGVGNPKTKLTSSLSKN
eukprot:sb/3476685/